MDRCRDGPAFVVIAVFIAAIFLSQAEAKKPKLITYPPTYRTFPYAYEKVWNAVVRLVLGDLKYTPRVADPQLGFLSTNWKIIKGKGKENLRRIRLHINVKKAPKGTLVTVRCEIEEYVPIAGTKEGKWMQIPSDHSCEAKILDQLAAKLKS